MIETKKENAVKLMGALLRMPPKPHSEMKLNKVNNKRVANPTNKASRAASAKPKTA
jgi:hypothetical protein